MISRLILRSGNDKTGKVAVTYTSIVASCPVTCPLRGEGCTAQGGRVYMQVMRHLDAQPATALEAAQAEAREIIYWSERAPEGWPLRLHVGGDCRANRYAIIVSTACKAWPGPVWTYTHAWRTVDRFAWGNVSVLASVEDAREGRAALTRGYAPALIVSDLPEDGRAFTKYGIRWIPCPQQTRGIQCRECRLCFDAEKLRERAAGIAFEAHGTKRSSVIRQIRQLPLFRESAA